MTVTPADIVTQLHPWLDTPEAQKAAERAVQVPLAVLPRLAATIGAEELQAQAQVFLTECALPPRDQSGSDLSRECAGAHAGAMWGWPENERLKYAIREVGYALCNWVRVTLGLDPQR